MDSVFVLGLGAEIGCIIDNVVKQDASHTVAEDLGWLDAVVVAVVIVIVHGPVSYTHLDVYKRQLVNSATELSFSDIMSIEVLSNNRESPGRSSYEPIKAEFRINVKENRLCTIKFNSSQFEERAYGQSPVKQVTIYKNRAHDNRTTDRLSVLDGQFKDGNGNRAFKWNKGINSLQLHKLDFDQGYYHVGVQWIPAILSQDLDEDWSDALGLSVRCFWGEYDSSTVVNGVSKRKIPSFDELLTCLLYTSPPSVI